MPNLVNICLQKPSEWEDFASQLDGNKKANRKPQILSFYIEARTGLWYPETSATAWRSFQNNQINIVKATNISILNIFADDASLKHSHSSFQLLESGDYWQKISSLVLSWVTPY